ncbi:hypothetical protein D3C87_2052160 [compost metagenome]
MSVYRKVIRQREIGCSAFPIGVPGKIGIAGQGGYISLRVDFPDAVVTWISDINIELIVYHDT